MEELLSLIMVCLFICGGSWSCDSIKCHNKAKVMNKKYTWGITTGCMIEHKGNFIPLQNYRVENSE